MLAICVVTWNNGAFFFLYFILHAIEFTKCMLFRLIIDILPENSISYSTKIDAMIKTSKTAVLYIFHIRIVKCTMVEHHLTPVIQAKNQMQTTQITYRSCITIHPHSF